MDRIIDPEMISSRLDWKEFEGLASRALESLGFRTRRNERFVKPRMEIDLLADRDGTAFAIDCKHWKRTVGRSTMLRISQKQISRSKRVIEELDFQRVVPTILTWHDEMLHILESGVPIVPIHKLSDFILNWESCGDGLLVLRKRRSRATLPVEQQTKLHFGESGMPMSKRRQKKKPFSS
ncbi:MAG TPA: restriction endonuclease [Nitrososphaerales archaeon]|nr:restriction endonuclease [Nitrososphaerales archaeon]